MTDLEKRLKQLEEENSRLKQENSIFKSRTIATNNLFNELKLGMVVLDLEGKIVSYNGVITQIYGLDDSEDLHYLDFISDNDKIKAKETFELISSNNFVGPIEYNLQKNNFIFPTSITISVLEENNQKTGYLALIEDLSDKKELEKRIDLEERKYKNLIDNLNEIIYEVNEEGILTFVSNSISKHFSYNSDEIKGKNLFDFVYEEDKEKVYLNFQNSLNGIFNPLLFRAYDKDGSLRYIETSSIPKVDDGDIIGVTGIFSDVTEKIAIQKHLEKSEEKYRLLFENMSSGFSFHEIVLDKYGNPIDYIFKDVNPAFEKLTGLKKEDIIDKRVKEILPGTEKLFIEKYGEVAINGQSINFKSFSKEIDKYFDIIAYSPMKNTFASVFVDITEEKKIEKDLQDMLVQKDILLKEV